jgi:outer membrane protein TolC
MTSRSFILILSLSPFLLAPAVAAAEAAGEPVTFSLCHKWSEARSESLKLLEEDVRQARARARAALGGALPRLEWDLTDTWQDPKGVEKLEAKGFSGFVEKDQVESKLSLKQPLFSGFREFSASAGFKHESARNALRMRTAARDLYELTAEAFYAVLDQEAQRENTAAAYKLAKDRVKDLGGFRRLGKARDSEVFTAEARAEALNAQVQQLNAAIVSAREDLSFLTGQDLSARPLTDEMAEVSAVAPLEEVQDKTRNRSDIKALREEVAARALRVRYERGSYWPGADVTGNYYTKRPTFMDDIGWDVVLSLRVPLFQGGTVAAQVKEAKSALAQAQLSLEEGERRALHAVRKTRAELASALLERESLESAAKAAEKSYAALQAEYKLGLVTNLDVLQALDFLVAQKSARDAAGFRAKLLSIQLALSTEQLP